MADDNDKDRAKLNPVDRVEREKARGAERAAANAERLEEAEKAREEEQMANITDAAEAEAAVNEDAARRAEEVKGQVGDQPPPGPGLPKPNPRAVAATMDPNNPVLNPDASNAARMAPRDMPPGARTPAPVPVDETVQTQAASKPPTEEHAKAGEENRGAAETPPPDYGEPSGTTDPGIAPKK